MLQNRDRTPARVRGRGSQGHVVLERAVPTSRAAVSLDGEWRFVADPERLYGPDALPGGEAIDVPGCWEAQVPRPYRIITAWYRRAVDIPADWRGDRGVVPFRAAVFPCSVYVNRPLIRAHRGG